MGAVSEYLVTIDAPDRQALERVYRLARETVPSAEEGTSYGMPALLYQGKGLVSTMRTKKFLSVYPFSGSVVRALVDELSEFETTTGSIHYSAVNPLPDTVLRRLVGLRRSEIDATLSP